MPKISKKTIKFSGRVKIDKVASKEQVKILTTISGIVNKALTSRERPSIYYRTSNSRDLDVYMVVDDYNPRTEDRIYGAQAKIITRYKESDIDFRLVPRHNLPENKIIPRGFKKLTTV